MEEASIEVFRVKLTQQTDEGRMFYIRDPQIEQHLLFIQSLKKRKYAYYINVGGGEAFFLIDAKRIIINAEFLYGRKRWRKSDLIESPKPQIAANLEFINLHTKANELEMPVSITTDENYSYAYVLLGKEEPEERLWVELSEKCFALLSEIS